MCGRCTSLTSAVDAVRQALAQDMKEVLPLYNKAAQQHYQNVSQAPDWSSILGSSGSSRRASDAAKKPAGAVRRPGRTPAPAAAVSSLRNISTAGSAATSQTRKTA